jgi:hypothetical protein
LSIFFQKINPPPLRERTRYVLEKSTETTHPSLDPGRLLLVELLKTLEKIYDRVVSLQGDNPGEGENLLAHNKAYLLEHGFA